MSGDLWTGWDDVSKWYFAVAGLETAVDSLELGTGITMARLKDLPTRTELTGHLKNSLVAGVMQHYVDESTIEHELIIDSESVDDPAPIYEQADRILAGLRIRTEAEILCPAVCDRSWSDLRLADPNSCLANLMERAMYSHPLDSRTSIIIDDLDWINDNLETLANLKEDPRFMTALDALSTYMHAANYRMMAAQLWAGIESIFAVKFEVSYSMSLWAALLLETRGRACGERRAYIKKLYGDRSRAVHGEAIDNDHLKKHVAEARGLLAQLLAKIIERGEMLTQDDFHDLTTMP